MMKRTGLLMSAVASLFLAAACNEADAPTAPKATVDVVVYIDSDSSGSLSANDEMLEGVPVVVYQGETQVGSGTTNANGHAFIDDIPPGSYRVEITGGPAGAALVTNSRPSAIINAQGDTAAVEFRFVYFPGVVEGVIYRDDNANGALDASDTRGPGLWVFLHASTGGTAGAKLDSVRTDNSGMYRFGRVAPGNYFLTFEQPSTITYTTTGPAAITVAPQSTVSTNRVFTGSLILTIAEARAKAVGSVVAVEGNVTTPPNIFTSGTGGVNSEIWIQDATGGIAVFSVLSSEASTYPLGQRVRVTGTIGSFSGQLQIAAPSLTVAAIAGGAVVSPTGITGASLAARTHEGKLVTISTVTITSVPTGTGTSFTVTGTDATGAPVSIRVGGANTGLTRASFTVGEKYTITGIQTVFISGTTVTPQIKPRFSTDVVLQPTATPGMIVITELMADPAVTSDANGEYFELYNAGGTAVDLTGWTFVDASTSSVPHTISGITIGPGEYRLFGVDANPATNGGLTVDRVYTPISLNNTGGDRLVLKNASGVTVDSVAYTTQTTGKAFGIIDPRIDSPNMNGSNWQLQTSTYNANNSGTPRARNDGQVGPVADRASSSSAVTRRPVSTDTPRGRDR